MFDEGFSPRSLWLNPERRILLYWLAICEWGTILAPPSWQAGMVAERKRPGLPGLDSSLRSE